MSTDMTLPVEPDHETWTRGDWSQTFTGRRYYPMAPRAEDIHTADIAHALSMLCRYGGHVTEFYSVAEHCVLMSRAVEQSNGKREALYALLHDATEAYVVDVPRPVKRYLPDYNVIEERVWAAIVEKFDLPTATLPDSVFKADTRILVNEVGRLFPRAENWPSLAGLEPLPIYVAGWSPARAEREYLLRLRELGVTLDA